jgi:hypothetical protein
MELPREFSVATERDELPHDIAIRTLTPVKRKFEEASSRTENGTHTGPAPMDVEAEVFERYLTIPSDEGSEFERPSKRQTVSRSQSIQPTTESEDVLVRAVRGRSQAHAHRLDEAYNDNYRITLNEQIRDAMFKVDHRTLSKNSAFDDSYVGGTLWRAAEKEKFFVALARHGRNFSHIASAVDKTMLEVSLYADILAHGLEEQRKYQFEFDIQDVEGAADMPVESFEDIETAADGLAWKQFRHDIAREVKRYGDRWLITGNKEDDDDSDTESTPTEERRSEASAGSIWAADHAMLTAKDHELSAPEIAESAVSPPPALPENVQALASVRQLIESQNERPTPRPEKPKPLRKTVDRRSETPAETRARRSNYTRRWRKEHPRLPASGFRIEVEDLEASDNGSQPIEDIATQAWTEQPWRDQPWRHGPKQPRSRFERASSIALSDMSTISSMSASTTFSNMADDSIKVCVWWKRQSQPEKRMKLLPVAHLSGNRLKKECVVRGIWVHTVVASAATFAEALVDPTWTGIEEFGTTGKDGTNKAKFHSPKAMREIDFGSGSWVQRGMVLRFIPEGQKYGYYWEDDPVVLVAGYNVPNENEDQRSALRDTSLDFGQWIDLGTGMRSASEPAVRQASSARVVTRANGQSHRGNRDHQEFTMSEVPSQVGDHGNNDTHTWRSADDSGWQPQNELVDLTFDNDSSHMPEPDPEPRHTISAPVRKHVSKSEPPQEESFDPEFSFRLRGSRTPDPSRAVPRWIEEMLEEDGISVPAPQFPSLPLAQDGSEVEPTMDHEPAQSIDPSLLQVMDHEPARPAAYEAEQPKIADLTARPEDGPEPRIKQESPPNEIEATPLVEYETPFDPRQAGERPTSVSSTEYVPSEPQSEEGRQIQPFRLVASATNENVEVGAPLEAEEEEASSEDEKADKFTKHIFHSDALIHLSRSFFLNSSEPSLQWSTYLDHFPIPRKVDGESTSINVPLESPAIFRSGYNALAAIVRELTRKLVYSSYHRACIRMRSEDDVNTPPASSVLVRDSDVHSAIDALHLARDSRKFWATWAERHECNWEYSFEARIAGSEGLSIPVGKELAVQCLRLGLEGEEEGEILRLVLAAKEEALRKDQESRVAEHIDGDRAREGAADNSEVDVEMEDGSEEEDVLKDDPEDERREREIDEADQERSTVAMRKLWSHLRGTTEEVNLDGDAAIRSSANGIDDQGEMETGTTGAYEESRGNTATASVKPDDAKKLVSGEATSSSSDDDSTSSSDDGSSSDEDESDSE